MKFDKLIGEMDPYVMQEIRGASRKLLKEGIDLRALGGRLVSPRMQMQTLLFEFAPGLFNPIAPGGIGGQLDNLDRQANRTPLPPRFLGWFVGPMPGQLDTIEAFLGFQAQEDIGMEMERPIILDEPDALGCGITRPHELIEGAQLFGADFAPPLEEDTPAEGIQGRHHAHAELELGALVGIRAVTARLVIGLSNAGLLMEGAFILIKQDLFGMGLDPLFECLDACQFLVVGWIRTVNIATGALVMDAQPTKQAPETRTAVQAQAVTARQQMRQRPVRALYPQLVRVTTHQMQQRLLGLFAGVPLRGKKRACAHVLAVPAGQPPPPAGSGNTSDRAYRVLVVCRAEYARRARGYRLGQSSAGRHSVHADRVAGHDHGAKSIPGVAAPLPSGAGVWASQDLLVAHLQWLLICSSSLYPINLSNFIMAPAGAVRNLECAIGTGLYICQRFLLTLYCNP